MAQTNTNGKKETTEATALATMPQPHPQPNRGVALAAVDPMTLAGHFVKSGFFKDARDQSQAIVRILYGQEHGIAPVSAMMNVHIIDGKPSMGASMIGAVIRRSGVYDYSVVETTDKRCVLAFFRGQEKLGESVYTLEDAARAKLTGKTNWQNYPKSMLFARAMSAGARTYTPDVFLGAIYTPEEMGAEVDESGNVIDITPPPTTVEVAPAQPEPERTPFETFEHFAGGHLRKIGCDVVVVDQFVEVMRRALEETGDTQHIATLKALLIETRRLKTPAEVDQRLAAAASVLQGARASVRQARQVREAGSTNGQTLTEEFEGDMADETGEGLMNEHLAGQMEAEAAAMYREGAAQ